MSKSTRTQQRYKKAWATQSKLDTYLFWPSKSDLSTACSQPYPIAFEATGMGSQPTAVDEDVEPEPEPEDDSLPAISDDAMSIASGGTYRDTES